MQIQNVWLGLYMPNPLFLSVYYLKIKRNVHDFSNIQDDMLCQCNKTREACTMMQTWQKTKSKLQTIRVSKLLNNI